MRRIRRELTALRSSSVAIAAALSVGCASGSRVASSAPVARLNDVDVQQLAALLEAADARRRDTIAVDRALASPNSFVRAFAARTVGQNGMTARAGALRSLVADGDSMIAADAAFALGLMHDSTAASVLANALDRGPSVAAAATWSLGELGQDGPIELLLRIGEPAAAMADLLQAAAKLRPVPSAAVLPYLTHPNIAVRRNAVYAVTRSRVPAATGALLALAQRLTSNSEPGAGRSDAEVDLRAYLARGLGRPVTGDSLAPAALVALQRLVEDDHPHVRINAIRSLATYNAEARSALVRHFRDPDANARIALAQSLGGVLAVPSPDWEDAWRADTGFTFRRALLSTAMRSGVRLSAIDPSASDAWQRSSNWRYRAAAAEASGAGSNADLDAIAVPLLRDPDGRVRNAAFGAAVGWTDSTIATSKPYGRAALSAALADSDLFVRATILDGLRSRARSADARVALAAYRRAAKDPENDARIAALRVVASAWRSDSVSFGPLRDSLAALPAPTDPLERAAGRTIGPLADWPPKSATPRAMTWYVEQIRSFVASDLAGHPPRATITTSRGAVQLVLRGADAPLTVFNFVQLARRGYYNNLVFHRVVPNFVAQDGDPRGDGSGGPGYAIRDELNRLWYDRGAVGMALSGPDTGGSQYFLTHSPQPHLDGHYTVFGHVTAGLDVLDSLVQGDRILNVTIH